MNHLVVGILEKETSTLDNSKGGVLGQGFRTSQFGSIVQVHGATIESDCSHMYKRMETTKETIVRIGHEDISIERNTVSQNQKKRLHETVGECHLHPFLPKVKDHIHVKQDGIQWDRVPVAMDKSFRLVELLHTEIGKPSRVLQICRLCNS